jgi:isopentenyldiphosphate isomerase
VSGAAPDGANKPDELLDLVDQDDRVIGTVRKGAAERDPALIHREVAILIHRDGRLLWQLRSAAKTVMALTWDFACAGHVGSGDAPLASARRELFEELGVELELQALERRLVRTPTETHFAYLYAAALPAGTALRLDPDEVAAVEWCDEAGYRRWHTEGRRLSPVACEVSEAFWAGRWSIRR